jgi:hypothetical protein
MMTNRDKNHCERLEILFVLNIPRDEHTKRSHGFVVIHDTFNPFFPTRIDGEGDVEANPYFQAKSGWRTSNQKGAESPSREFAWK